MPLGPDRQESKGWSWAKPGRRAHILIHHRVILHRARPQGIEGRCRTHIPLRQPREMADHFAFADLGKVIQRLPAQCGRQIAGLITLGDIVPWERGSRPVRLIPAPISGVRSAPSVYPDREGELESSYDRLPELLSEAFNRLPRVELGCAY